MAEVVQDAQQDWTVGIAAERAHSQAAEARAEHAEAAVEAAQAAASQKDAGTDGRLSVPAALSRTKARFASSRASLQAGVRRDLCPIGRGRLSVGWWAHSLQRAGEAGIQGALMEGVGGDVEVCGVLHPQG
jgi:hypothetical protein